MSDFMNDKEEVQETEKITIGDQEFGQEELEELVGLGRIGKEAQEKFNTSIDKVYPAYTKATQRVKELEGSATELEELKAKIAQQQEAPSAFTPEAKEAAKKQLTELMGGAPMTEAQFDEKYEARRARDKNVETLLTGVENVMADIKAEGKPEVEKDALLEYMKVNDYRNPATAYKEMKDEELDIWRSTKITDAKRPGLHTVTTSQPGGKQPPKVDITLDNLGKLTREALGQG